MYRIFFLGWSGRLYQLGSEGWVREDGTNFQAVEDIREFMALHFVPEPIGENGCADCYVGAIDAEGLLITTFALYTVPA